MIKRLLASIGIVLVTLLSAVMPVAADSSDIILDGGYVGKVVGWTWDGKAIYQTDFGAPEYLPDLKTKIDTTWHTNPDGSFQSGANLLSVYSDGEFVKISDNASNSIYWSPIISVSKLDTKLDKSGITPGVIAVKVKAQILSVDPINSHYNNNTLQWDYGNGVYRRARLIEGSFQEYYIITQPIAGDFTIIHSVTKSPSFSGKIGEPIAWDANYQKVDLQADNQSILLTKDKALDTKLAYPITIDPDTTFTTSASDGYVYVDNTVSYANVWGAAGSTAISTATNFALGQYKGLSNWAVYRGAVYVDTSPLSGYTITAANLNLYGKTDGSDTDFDVTITNGQPTYPHDPLVSGDYNKTNYAVTDGGHLTTVGWSTSAYNVIPLNATGLTWISTTGTTKFFLRSSLDIAGTTPTGNEYLLIYTYEQGAGYRPQLVVTYTAGTVGVIATAASNVAYSTARLNSSITDDGGDNVSVRFGFGNTTQTAGNFTSYGNVTDWTAYIYNTGNTPYYDAASLLNNTTYYYRVQARNSSSNATSTSEISFTTANSIGNIANFYGNPSSTSIKLNWTLGTGDTGALVRYRPDIFPTTTADGTQVYAGNLTSYSHSGLTSGVTYYYAIWGESGGSYSSGNLTLAMTTTLAATAGDTLEEAPTPPEWNQAPDATGLANLTGIYPIMNDFFASWGISANNGWASTFLLVSMIAGFGVWLWSKKLLIGVFITMGLMLIGVVLGITPATYLAVLIAIVLGVWAIERQVT